jgi:hypothetical protein
MKNKTLIPMIVNELIENIFFIEKGFLKKIGKNFQYFSKFKFTLGKKRKNPKFSKFLIKK